MTARRVPAGTLGVNLELASASFARGAPGWAGGMGVEPLTTTVVGTITGQPFPS